uniref:Peptidase C19 ubiquitin carboxyl-terminal hydrolase domain-containing protein n=1 Tax=Chromera velia CCMP2878 TaxID=1169474 RepID=A0A0G4HNR1_9ALVE|eukprot:Cvel_29508.t1-p1 / transcript=Cvel_29508.t1 / gene=Cvel_29508 / organism=Chromera_velia_CCMP2878 / gene_product=Inactive ubiquitin carboxyl-terminal hydrolase 53, putative / transcript_product=Inactive ubiquitin carboxyl-terminal hydrolase 53, putative / location=Cvel_scaffold4053:78-6474(-) / protein_length=914 / sequence_SO=supercontig / SO=protein_coding / is_pseudo=false
MPDVSPTIKGLLNAPGSNHCFLNVLIQAFWNLRSFREAFVSAPEHRHWKNPGGAAKCAYCALKTMFAHFQYSQSPALPPDELRRVLSTVFGDSGRFRLGAMEDADETLEVLLTLFHASQIILDDADEEEDEEEAQNPPDLLSGQPASSSSHPPPPSPQNPLTILSSQQPSRLSLDSTHTQGTTPAHSPNFHSHSQGPDSPVFPNPNTPAYPHLGMRTPNTHTQQGQHPHPSGGRSRPGHLSTISPKIADPGTYQQGRSPLTSPSPFPTSPVGTPGGAPGSGGLSPLAPRAPPPQFSHQAPPHGAPPPDPPTSSQDRDGGHIGSPPRKTSQTVRVGASAEDPLESTVPAGDRGRETETAEARGEESGRPALNKRPSLKGGSLKEFSELICNPRCIAHDVFGYELVHFNQCSCGATTEPESQAAFIYRVLTSEAQQAAEALETVAQKVRSFSEEQQRGTSRGQAAAQDPSQETRRLVHRVIGLLPLPPGRPVCLPDVLRVLWRGELDNLEAAQAALFPAFKRQERTSGWKAWGAAINSGFLGMGGGAGRGERPSRRSSEASTEKRRGVRCLECGQENSQQAFAFCPKRPRVFVCSLTWPTDKGSRKELNEALGLVPPLLSLSEIFPESLQQLAPSSSSSSAAASSSHTAPQHAAAMPPSPSPSAPASRSPGGPSLLPTQQQGTPSSSTGLVGGGGESGRSIPSIPQKGSPLRQPPHLALFPDSPPPMPSDHPGGKSPEEPAPLSPKHTNPNFEDPPLIDLGAPRSEQQNPPTGRHATHSQAPLLSSEEDPIPFPRPASEAQRPVAPSDLPPAPHISAHPPAHERSSSSGGAPDLLGASPVPHGGACTPPAAAHLDVSAATPGAHRPAAFRDVGRQSMTPPPRLHSNNGPRGIGIGSQQPRPPPPWRIPGKPLHVFR